MPRKNEPPAGTDYSKLSSDELIRICAENANPAAWGAFIQRFDRRVSTVVCRVARRYTPAYPALRDDLSQEVYLRLCKNGMKVLRDYIPRHENGAIAYLGVVAASTVHDFFRNRGNPPIGGDELPDSGPPIDRGEDWRDLLRDVDKILRAKAVSVRDREIFRLYFIHGLTARQISEIRRYSLSDKGVENVVRKLGRIIRDELDKPPNGKAA